MLGSEIIRLLVYFGFAVLIIIIAYIIIRQMTKSYLVSSREVAKKIIEEAKIDAENIRKKAELEMMSKLNTEKLRLENEFADKRKELEKIEKRLREREQVLNTKDANLASRESEILRQQREIASKEKILKAKTERLDQLISISNERLEKIANLSAEEAKRELLKNLEHQAQLEAAQLIRDIKERAKRDAEIQAREIIISAIQRCALSQVMDTTVSVVNLPSEELKGRIIGREGRNIRTFESLTGVEVIIDDTPNAIILSAFDPIRREVARIAMERLIQDGRIHQARIEEIVEKTKKELEANIINTGEAVLLELGITDIANELIEYLGRLQYRTSFGQNVLLHSKEVAILAGAMAQELGLDGPLAKRAGLLHDIGKAADLNIEGPHALIGAQLAQKYGEDEIVVNAIAAHHEDESPTSPYAFLTSVADSISGSRPGARRDNFESYINRLQNLETIANSFDGVDRAYAIQAGREIRVMVQPEKISDAQAEELARQISKQIEAQLKYPGQIKVVVIREKRVIDYAR
ncbi:MAG: ribonuclease Y [candidate division WOR-3 bacterium]